MKSLYPTNPTLSAYVCGSQTAAGIFLIANGDSLLGLFILVVGVLGTLVLIFGGPSR